MANHESDDKPGNRTWSKIQNLSTDVIGSGKKGDVRFRVGLVWHACKKRYLSVLKHYVGGRDMHAITCCHASEVKISGQMDQHRLHRQKLCRENDFFPRELRNRIRPENEGTEPDSTTSTTQNHRTEHRNTTMSSYQSFNPGHPSEEDDEVPPLLKSLSKLFKGICDPNRALMEDDNDSWDSAYLREIVASSSPRSKTHNPPAPFAILRKSNRTPETITTTKDWASIEREASLSLRSLSSLSSNHRFRSLSGDFEVGTAGAQSFVTPSIQKAESIGGKATTGNESLHRDTPETTASTTVSDGVTENEVQTQNPDCDQTSEVTMSTNDIENTSIQSKTNNADPSLLSTPSNTADDTPSIESSFTESVAPDRISPFGDDGNIEVVLNASPASLIEEIEILNYTIPIPLAETSEFCVKSENETEGEVAMEGGVTDGMKGVNKMDVTTTSSSEAAMNKEIEEAIAEINSEDFAKINSETISKMDSDIDAIIEIASKPDVDIVAGNIPRNDAEINADIDFESETDNNNDSNNGMEGTDIGVFDGDSPAAMADTIGTEVNDAQNNTQTEDCRIDVESDMHCLPENSDATISEPNTHVDEIFTPKRILFQDESKATKEENIINETSASANISQEAKPWVLFKQESNWWPRPMETFCGDCIVDLA